MCWELRLPMYDRDTSNKTSDLNKLAFEINAQYNNNRTPNIQSERLLFATVEKLQIDKQTEMSMKINMNMETNSFALLLHNVVVVFHG